MTWRVLYQFLKQVSYSGLKNYHVILKIKGADIPSLKDLLSNVVEQYAPHWEELASFLGLKDHRISIIFTDYSKSGCVACCKAALRQWLKETPSPTWGKLEDSVKKLSIRKPPHDTMGMQYI